MHGGRLANRGPEPAIDWPDLTEKGNARGRSQANIAAFLDRIGAGLAFNELAYCTVMRRNGRESLLTDEAAKDLWLEADAAGLGSGEAIFVAVLENMGRRNAFHPVRNYLNGLEWDGIERLDTWLAAFLDAEDTELTRAYGRKTLIGAVRRIRAARLQTRYVFGAARPSRQGQVERHRRPLPIARLVHR